MTQKVVIIAADTQALDQKRNVIAEARALAVVDVPSFGLAGTYRQTLKAYMDTVAEAFDPNIKRWHEGHKAALAQKASYYRPAEEAYGVLGANMAEYDRAQEEVRRIAAAMAERERVIAEVKAMAEAEAERRRLEREAEDRLLEAALAAQEAGDGESATRILEQPVEPVYVAPTPAYVPPAAVPERPVAAGTSFRESWTGELMNLSQLVTAVASGRVPVAILQVNVTELNRLAKVWKAELGKKVPGTRAVNKPIATTRGGWGGITNEQREG
jgi:hypothetical protein